MRTFPQFLWPMGYENDITFFWSGGWVSILAKVQFLKGSKDIFLLRLRPWGERNNKDAVYFQIKLKSPALLLFCWDLEGGFYAKEKTQTVKFTRKIKRNTQQNTQVFCIVIYRIHLLFTPCVLFSSSWTDWTSRSLNFTLKEKICVKDLFYIHISGCLQRSKSQKNVPVWF